MGMFELLERKFEAIGARATVRFEEPRFVEFSREMIVPRLDIREDGKGEYFDIHYFGRGTPAPLDVVDCHPRERHLLLLARAERKSKFLCGHDERHWFVAAVPEASRGVATVPTAMEALRPEPVLHRMASERIAGEQRFSRKNRAFRRQGEWFFLPEPGLVVDPKLVLRNEPLSRGAGSKPHRMEFAYRLGGTTVYVNQRYPIGMAQAEYAALSEEDRREAERLGGRFRIMTRDPLLYARGRIAHADHATITLNVWHRVVMNTENNALARQHVAFLD